MMSIPFLAGFSPHHWRKVVDVMLEKDISFPRVHRFCTLALLESDFNQAIQIIIACQLGFKLEDKSLISTMQYGSDEGRQCTSAVLHKQLAHDIIHNQKNIAAFIENDTIGCYDRMTNNLLLLELQCLGLQDTAITSLSQTWENTIHHKKRNMESHRISTRTH
jgi:hypothetical protein